MTVFKTFWKVVSKYKGTIILYTVMLIVFGGLNMSSNNTDITLNWDNLEYLCLDCHNLEHNFEREKKSATRKGLKFNEKGELVKDE